MPRIKRKIRLGDAIIGKAGRAGVDPLYAFEQTHDCQGLTTQSKLGVCHPAAVLWLGLMRRHGNDACAFDIADEILLPSNLRDVINYYDGPSTRLIGGRERGVKYSTGAELRLMRKFGLSFSPGSVFYGAMTKQTGRFQIFVDYVQVAGEFLVSTGSKLIWMRESYGGQGHAIAMHSIGVPGAPAVAHVLFDANFGALFFASSRAFQEWWWFEFKGSRGAYQAWQYIEVFRAT